MPHLQIGEEDMQKSLLFFPLTGLCIGAVLYALHAFMIFLSLPLLVRTLISVLIPVLLTGGFHLDGFMDTADALHSYLPREKKLEIMKDPHCGAFSVISLVSFLLALNAAVYILSETEDRRILFCMAMVFVMSRSLSGISSLLFTKAKKEGMLAVETGNGGRGILCALAVQCLLAVAFMCFAHIAVAAAVLLSFVLTLCAYKRMSYKQFGGVTGDTAGYFVSVSELFACIAAAAAVIVIRMMGGGTCI